MEDGGWLLNVEGEAVEDYELSGGVIGDGRLCCGDVPRRGCRVSWKERW